MRNDMINYLLRTFLHNDEKLEKIGTGQTQMLQLQLEAMERYNEFLNSRILYMISGSEKK
ncbi:crAss001_48 related protein [Lactobacillus taiwanensis]|uniref:crAss001_48 related protein n=1 Tax=Lactobacillus taiwanensis TaxID=508451 RepID=UPI003D300AAC